MKEISENLEKCTAVPKWLEDNGDVTAVLKIECDLDPSDPELAQKSFGWKERCMDELNRTCNKLTVHRGLFFAMEVTHGPIYMKMFGSNPTNFINGNVQNNTMKFEFT